MKWRFSFLLPIMALALLLMGTSWIPTCDRTSDGGVFKSTDNGYTWQQKNTIGEKENLNQAEILSLKIDPNNSAVIYSGVKGKGLYKTIDAGDSWRRVVPIDSDIHAIAVDAKDSNLVYAASLEATIGKIYKSPNAFEETIEEILVDPRSGQALMDIVIDSYDSSRIYTISEQGGIYKSTDFGSTWAAKYWAKDKLNRVRLSPSDSRVVYVSSTGNGLLKSIDGGETWTEIKESLSKFPGAQKIHDLVVLSNELVYIATDYGLLKSINGGNNWEQVRTLIAPEKVPITAMTVDPVDSNIIFFSAASSIHKTVNGGATWADWLLPTARQVSTLVLDPKSSEVIYAGTIKVKK